MERSPIKRILETDNTLDILKNQSSSSTSSSNKFLDSILPNIEKLNSNEYKEKELRKKIILLEYQLKTNENDYNIKLNNKDEIIRSLQNQLSISEKDKDELLTDEVFIFNKNKEVNKELSDLKIEYNENMSKNQIKINNLQKNLSLIEKSLNNLTNLNNEKDILINNFKIEIKNLKIELNNKLLINENLTNELKLKDENLKKLLIVSNDQNQNNSNNKIIDKSTNLIHYENEISNNIKYIRELEFKNLQISNKLKEFQGKRDFNKILIEENKELKLKLEKINNINENYEELKKNYNILKKISNKNDNGDDDDEKLKQLEIKNSELINNLRLIEKNLINITNTNEINEIKLNNLNNLKDNKINFLNDILKNFENENNYLKKMINSNEDLNHSQFIIDNFNNIIKKFKLIENKIENFKILTESDSNKRTFTNTDKLIKDYQETIITKTNEIKDLKIELNQLKSEINKLLPVKSEYRIIELVNNPTNKIEKIKLEMINQLRIENEELIKSIDNDNNDKLIPISVYHRLNLDIKLKEDEIKSLNKRINRLKELYSKKTNKFNEIIYKLLGYKIEIINNDNLIKITNKFFNNKNSESGLGSEYILINLKNSKNLNELIEFNKIKEIKLNNDKLNNLINFWINEKNDFPCFLSALNLELFEKTNQ